MRQLPNALVGVALIDAETCAAVGSVSVSWWNEEVRTGRAPQPIIRRTRFTRWRLLDVREFWLKFARESESEAANVVMMRAHKASDAAKLKREQ